MTDREVQAISQFLLNFGYLGCYQITVCRRNVEKLSKDQIGQVVLDIREAWKREGLDVENLYTNDLELFPGMSKKWGLSFLINTQQAPPDGRRAAWPGRDWPTPISGSTAPSASLVSFSPRCFRSTTTQPSISSGSSRPRCTGRLDLDPDS